MAEQVPVLIGVAGLVDGEVFPLADGVEVVIGRSRSCTVSLRRVVNYLNAPQATRDADHDFNTVSRRHLRVTVAATTASIEDLSTNGTQVNGQALDGPQQIDLASGGCVLRLGTREQFELRLVDRDDPRLEGRAPVGATAG
ncbi:MAG: FHA domain-containing protein [Planctomycetes bacterium]|jgi:pSer/pThr/pTyr-binding forkhead associated (FHA) protein|nr:FHA domain-containing protein [Planctomycetota bacterium]